MNISTMAATWYRSCSSSTMSRTVVSIWKRLNQKQQPLTLRYTRQQSLCQACINKMQSANSNTAPLSIIQLSPMDAKPTKKKYKRKEEAQESNSAVTISISSIPSTIKITSTTTNRNHSQLQISDLESLVSATDKTKEFKFEYTFNEYLRLVLFKILPCKNMKISILPEERLMRGPQNECEQLIKAIKSEIQLYSMKVVKNIGDVDIEELEFQLPKQYKIKIYRKKVLELAIKSIVENYRMDQDAKKLQDRIATENLFLVRVEKAIEQESMNAIQRIMSGDYSTKMPTMNAQKASNSSDDLEIVEDEQEPSYYQNSRQTRSQVVTNKRNQFNQEPYEDDSVSVAQNKNKRYKKKEEKREEEPKPNKETQLLIKQYEFQSAEFDMKSFEQWFKTRALLSPNIRTKAIKDPYNEDIISTYKVQLLRKQGQNEQQIIKEIEVYFKFRKVVTVNLKNQKYKDSIVHKFSAKEEVLTVQFVQGYKSPKWPENQMWRHVMEKKYSLEKKMANSEYFELFYLVGLKNLVVEKEKEILQALKNEPKEDSREEIAVKISSVSQHIQSHPKIKDIIREYTLKLISQLYKNICTFQSVQFPEQSVVVVLKVKFQNQQNFSNIVREQIAQKLKTDILTSEYKFNSVIDKFTYQKIEKICVVVQRKEKSFRYVSNRFITQDLIRELNHIFTSQNKIGEKEVKVQDKIVANKVEEYLQHPDLQKEYSEVKYNYVSDNNKIKLIGREYLLDSLAKKLEEYVDQIREQKIRYCQILKKKEGEILQASDVFKSINEKAEILLKVDKKDIACKIFLSKQAENFKRKNIVIIKSKSLDYAPFGSVFAFSSIKEAQLFKNHFLRTFKNNINHHHNKDIRFDYKEREYTFCLKPNRPASDLLKEAISIKRNPSNHIIFIMPQNNKETFVKTIIKELLENKQYESLDPTIMIIEFGAATDIQKQLNISPYVKGKRVKLKDEVKTIYFVTDGQNKFYYSQSGNSKILTAKEKGYSKVILNNHDLNILHESHQFSNANKNVIIHLQSRKQFAVNVLPRSVQFTINGSKYDMPPNEAAKVVSCISSTNPNQTCALSLGVYEIDLATAKQINLFSGYERSLSKEEVIIKAGVNQNQIQAFYNCKIAEVQFCYYQDSLQAFNKARTDINRLLSDSVVNREISFKDFASINRSNIEDIKASIEEDQETELACDFSAKVMTIRALNQNTANRCEQLINMSLKHMDVAKFEFPKEWQPQKDDIQVFEVNQNTQQFKDVQALFTVGKIKKLQRIQNKIIYKKYADQKAFLELLNKKPVRAMRLFHGTRNTNPEEIYRDKQESFNINYSSDNNLLGKGIYFAEKSEYSDNYKYVESTKGTIFGIGASSTHSMFLCEVLAGESQRCPGHNGAIKDTSFKNHLEKIKYESMTDFLNNSNIFVVYKSRRAYPLYLIKY